MSKRDDYLATAEAIIVEARVRRVVYVDRNLRAYHCREMGAIVTPTPTTINRLHSVAHECGHYYLHNDANGLASHRMEYEAERYSLAALERFGVPGNPQWVEDGQWYVLSKMRLARVRLIKADQESWEWCRPMLDGILSGKLPDHGWRPRLQDLMDRVSRGEIQLVDLGRADPTLPPPPRAKELRVRWYDGAEWDVRKSTTKGHKHTTTTYAVNWSPNLNGRQAVSTSVVAKPSVSSVIAPIEFDYGLHGIKTPQQRQLESCATKITTEVVAVRKRTTAGMFKIAEQLCLAHDKLAAHGNGTFTQWVEQRCEMTRMTAHRMMKAFKRLGQDNVRNTVLQTFDATACYVLSAERCGEGVIEEALRRAKAGEIITAKIAKQIIGSCTVDVTHSDPEHDDPNEVAKDRDDDDQTDANDGDIDEDTCTVNAIDTTPDDDDDRTDGIELEQLQDAYDAHVVPQLEAAVAPVRKQFYAWLKKTQIK